jgi:hypothetical protein
MLATGATNGMALRAYRNLFFCAIQTNRCKTSRLCGILTIALPQLFGMQVVAGCGWQAAWIARHGCG